MPSASPDGEPAIVISLPMPPGSNERMVPATHKTTGARILVLSAKARRWLRDARDDIFAQRKGRFIINRAAAVVSLAPSGFDADAPVKLLFDALEDGGAVGNDRLIRPFTVQDDPSIREGWLRVQLWDTGERYEVVRNDAAKKDRTLALALVRTFGRGSRHGLRRRG